MQFLNERGKQEYATGFAIECLTSKPGKFDLIGNGRNLSPLLCQPESEFGPAGQPLISRFSQNTFDSTNGDLNPLFGEKLGDLSCRQIVFAPTADL